MRVRRMCDLSIACNHLCLASPLKTINDKRSNGNKTRTSRNSLAASSGETSVKYVFSTRLTVTRRSPHNHVSSI